MDSASAGSAPSVLTDQELACTSLAVGSMASICRDRLADRLLAFTRCCPDIDIGVHEMPRGALLPALKAGDLALAVLPGSPEPGTRSVELWKDRVMVAIPPGHRFGDRAAIRASELREEPVLVSRQQSGGDVHRFLARRILPLGPALNATIIDLSLGMIVKRVAQGGGVALICESLAEHGHREVSVRPVEAPGAHFAVRAYWPDAEPQGPLKALIGALEDHA